MCFFHSEIYKKLYKLFSDINATNNSIIAQIERGLQEIKIYYPNGLNPTRKNVLDMYRKWGYGAVEFYFWCRIPKQKAKSIVRRVLPKETRQKIKQLLHK